MSCIDTPGRGSCRWAPESWSGSACVVQVPEGTLASCSCCSAAVYLNRPVLVADMDRNAAGMGGRVRFAGLGQILSLETVCQDVAARSLLHLEAAQYLSCVALHM